MAAASGQRLSPVGGEREPEDKEEPVAQFYLEAFLPYIAKSLKLTDLLCYHYFEPDVRKKFRQLSKSDSEENVVKEMLDTIMTGKHWPNRFKYLIDLMIETENEKVCKILQGEAIPDNKQKFTKLIQQFATLDICNNLNVMQVLPYLISHKVLSSNDKEFIDTTQSREGRWLGAFELVFLLPRRCVYWYQGFILSLIQSGHEELAERIDPALTNKFQEKLHRGDTSLIESDLTSMLIIDQEECMTDCGGSGITSGGKLNPDCDADETCRKQLYANEETEQKQFLSSDHGTMEADRISYTSYTQVSVNNLSPNEIEEEGSVTSNQSETVRRSLEQSLNSGVSSDGSLPYSSLTFNSLLKDKDNENTRPVEGSLGAQGYNLNEDLLRSGDRSDPELEQDSLANELVLMLDTSTSKSSMKTTDGNEESLNVPKGKSDFSQFQKLTVSKSKATSPSRDPDGSASNNVDGDSKEFKDKGLVMSGHQRLNITEGQQGLNITESASSVGADHEREEIDDKDISLRRYQEELAAPALQGKNVIIVAPTGSGKTRVAMRIIQEHIRKQQGKGIAKVIFLVNQVALANQQGDACRTLLRKYSSKVITGESQRKSECLKDFIDKRDILVVTAQVLLDGLVRKEISSINCFSLIIFDECHHTHANHTFNQIMGQYMDLKFGKAESALPQIVGLTASVGVGKARNVDKAVDHIKHLMANLDAQVISTVKNNMGELREHVSLPEEETCKVPKREGDKFGESVTLLMNTIERRICQSSLVKEIPEASVLEKALKAPAQKGSAQYTQWVSKLWRETAKLKSSEARRFLNSCRAHLEHYNNALIIYNDARMEDALSYLDTEITKWKENAIMDDNESILYGAFKKLRNHRFPKCSNPKLDKLLEMVTKAYNKDPENSRGIVFVKTRDLASAIVRWMTDTPGLRELKPIIFTGTNIGADKGGMTKAAQVDALEYFRDGKHKLIVATSVAEEGLDISKCNLVIRYDHVTNEIAMVQSRGRGRAADSKYYVIAEEKTGMAEKEELNMIREIMMRKAIIQLQEFIAENTGKFQQEIYKFQDEANLDRQLKSLGRGRKLIRMVGQFELRCIKCDKFICWSDNVKKIQDSHHVVIDDQLRERASFVKTSTVGFKDETVQFVGKLICKECGGNLGVICIHRTLEFPVLKIENFLVVDTNGRQSTCKRWKSVPFHVDPLSSEDWKEIVKARQESGES